MPFGGLHVTIIGDISHVQSAFYDGARPTNIDVRMRHYLGHLIMPSAAIPNFFIEVDGFGKDADVAERWFGYDGALGA